MGRHVRGSQARHTTWAGAMIVPPPLLGAGAATGDGRSAASGAGATRVHPSRGAGAAGSNPGAATVTLPDGTSFRTQPGRQYTVPVGSRMTLPSRITMVLDRPGPKLNIEDRSRIHVLAPDDEL